MATVEEIARDVIGSLGTDAGALLVAKWTDNRYQQLVSKVRPRHLRQVGELLLPAKVDDGLITTTRGSTDVSGDSDTTWATSPTTSPGEYWQFRASSAWYDISSVTDDDTITLSTAFAEEDITEGPYSIIKRYHALDATARWLGRFYHTRLRKEIPVVSLDELGLEAPGRYLVGSYPALVAQVGVDTSNYLKVEVYPPPENTEIIHYIFWDLPTTLTISSTIPLQIDPYVLKEGVLIDAYRYEKARALRRGNVDQAGIWRNDEKAQETIWKRAMQDAARTDRGVDDITLILGLRGPTGGYEQRTAHDIVHDRTWGS